MERKTFTTTIDKDLQNRFKARCAESGIKMNDILEIFMQMYVDGKFKLALKLDDEKQTKTIVEEKNE